VPEDIGSSERMLAQWQQDIQRKADSYREMADRVRAQSISERSGDGLIRVTIGSNGILTHLEIAEAAREKRMADVAAEVLRTLHTAQSRIPELLRQTMSETIGTADPTAEALFEEARANFPPAPADEPPAAPPPSGELRFGIEDERPAPPPPARRPRPPVDDDDFGGAGFLS
jgi:DNA-binding protein YbaB